MVVMYFITIALASFLGYCLLRATPPPILGVYQQPGKWYHLKFVVAYLLLTLRKILNNYRASQEHAKTPGYGVKSKSRVEDMEQPQPLSDHRKAVDAVYISGFDRNGIYIVTATARCPQNLVNGFAFLRIPGIGLLKWPKSPDSTLNASGDMTFGAEGILMEPVEPMKKWRVSYDGPMKFEQDDTKRVHVTMKLEWSSSLGYFDFDTDIPPVVMARALAKEPWSKEYFQTLKESHQTHYEQMGMMKGMVHVEGHKPLHVNMNAYRDHSYGHKREWCYMHRYGLHTAALEDGTMFTVGIVSQPINLSSLEMGYLYTPTGDLYGVEWCNLPLHYHGEGGKPPTDYAFSFKAGGELYIVQVNVLEASRLNMGLDWEARFVERFCTYNVNGLRGWGISEWEYRRHGGRDNHTSETTTD